MKVTQDPASSWQAVFDQIDTVMHAHPEEALKLCKQLFVESYLWEPPTYVRAAERYGKVMDHLGRSDEARDSLLAAQQAAQASCMPIDEARILERLARGYYSGGDYRRAMQHWDNCIDKADQAGGDAETWILAKVGLAQVYKGAGDHAAAVTMLAQAQARTAEVGDPHLDAKVKINLAVSLMERQRPQEASAILHEAFAICSAHQLFDYLAESNFYLAKIALGEAALERAMAYLDAALTAALQVNFRWCEAHIHALKAEVFARSGDFSMALQAVRLAQAIASADGFFDMLIHQHFAAAEYAASLNDFASAFAEHKAGRDCEQRLHVQAPPERSAELKDDIIEQGELEPALRLLEERVMAHTASLERHTMELHALQEKLAAMRKIAARSEAAGTPD
ncbi:MAG: hypothetical protein WKG03_15270 [Telluria sp.]